MRELVFEILKKIEINTLQYKEYSAELNIIICPETHLNHRRRRRRPPRRTSAQE